MFRRVGLGLAWLLAAFHGWLLAVQVLNGEIADPWLALRWAGALCLTAAFVRLRRSGRSILRGRKAVALWLMVALLHAPVIAQGLEKSGPALPETLTLLARQGAPGGTLLLLLVLAALTTRRRATRAFAAWRSRAVSLHVRAWLEPSIFSFAPRPPPAA